MDDTGPDGRKYIVGWLTLRPGLRDEFMDIARPYAATCRQEDGCLFFEMNPSESGPDVVLVTECFRDRAAHVAHCETPTFLAFWKELSRLCLTGRFENVYADHVVADVAHFDAPDGAPVNP